MAETDLTEMENKTAFGKVKKLLKDGCGCALGGKGSPCSGQFTETVVLFNLNNCLELSNDKLNLVVLQAYKLSLTVNPLVLKEAGVPDAQFVFSPYLSARRCFFHLHRLSDSRFRQLKEHYQTYVICHRIHGNNCLNYYLRLW